MNDKFQNVPRCGPLSLVTRHYGREYNINAHRFLKSQFVRKSNLVEFYKKRSQWSRWCYFHDYPSWLIVLSYKPIYFFFNFWPFSICHEVTLKVLVSWKHMVTSDDVAHLNRFRTAWADWPITSTLPVGPIVFWLCCGRRLLLPQM